MRQPPIPKGGDTVLVFMRAPEAGRVKTRLTPPLSPLEALELYRCMVADTLNSLSVAGVEAIVCTFPPRSVRNVEEWLGHRYTVRPQRGADLGSRMADAFRGVFAGGRTRALLVGADIPDLPAAIYREAFRALDDHPAVIGPAVDGGYYLIGFNRRAFLPEAFRDIAWGTQHVFEQTRRVFARHGIPPHRLPPWRDLDTFEDLKTLACGGCGRAASTGACLRRMGLAGDAPRVESGARAESD